MSAALRWRPRAARDIPRRTLVQDLRQTFREWQDDDGNLLAAAMACYAALSFLPLLLILISGFGLFLTFSRLGQNAETQILEVIAGYGSPALQQQVASALAQVREDAPLHGPVGLIVLLLAAISVFAQLQKAFDRIWDMMIGSAAAFWPRSARHSSSGCARSRCC